MVQRERSLNLEREPGFYCNLSLPGFYRNLSLHSPRRVRRKKERKKENWYYRDENNLNQMQHFANA